MFQYRQVLVRLRQGDSDRDIARSRLMGRRKVAALRGLAASQGWLSPEAPLPDDAALSAAIGQARRARSTISTVEPHRAQVERWAAEGVGGIAIHAALCRDHGYRGSYSAVRRMMAGIPQACRRRRPCGCSSPQRKLRKLISVPARCSWIPHGASLVGPGLS